MKCFITQSPRKAVREMFLFLTTLLLVPVLPTTAYEMDPPMTWNVLENRTSCQNSSYIFSFHDHNWHHALQQCRLYGGYLLSINSLQEQNCVLELAKQRNVTRGSRYYGDYWHDGEDKSLLVSLSSKCLLQQYKTGPGASSSMLPPPA